MSKLHFGFGVTVTLLFSMMAFSLFVAPALANSSQVTIIGGATNGNIFGSIQFDELNVTDTGVWRFDTAGGPVIATFTYGAVTPTIVYNSSVQHNFNTGSVLNVGAGGNDFGATNTLVGTVFSGTVDGSSNAFNNLGAAGNDLGATNTLVVTSFSGVTNHADWIQAGATGLDLFLRASADATGSIKLNTGGGDKIIVTPAGDIDMATTLDLQGNGLNNAGAAGNDFGGTNTLVATTFSGIITWHNSGSVGANTVILGANSPTAAGLAPATWIPVTLANTTIVFIPAWK